MAIDKAIEQANTYLVMSLQEGLLTITMLRDYSNT